MAAPAFFVTGTDTSVGKTHVTCALIRGWREAGVRACGFKPISSGDRTDALALLKACDEERPLEEINPVHFASPLAPLAASRIENRAVDFEAVEGSLKGLRKAYELVIVEGAGGWETPLSPPPGPATFADLAARWAFPVLLVIDNKLGSLNHTLLTVNAIRDKGLRCVGLYLNHCQEERDAASISNRVLLEELLDIPILDEILFDQESVSLPSLPPTPSRS